MSLEPEQSQPNPASHAIDEPSSRTGRLLRWILPFVVSAVLLGWILSGMDLAALVDRLTPRAALIFVPTLMVFLLTTLIIEAVCLVWVVSYYHDFSSWMLAARIKAASYLLGLINYALGAGAVALLLRRRASVPLSQAAGSVLLISLFDLGSLILITLVALGLREGETALLRTGAVALAALAMLAGFALLRLPISLGPIDRLRDLQVLQAARTLPMRLLMRLGVLRLAVVGSFIVLTGATLHAFDVAIPLVPLVVSVCVLLVVSAIPVAAAGLGTGQVAFVALFEGYAEPETLLAASLTISFGLIVTRAAMGLVFAREFTAEAFQARREIAP